ncbi:GNAT family N-acetyltransferase (plasmid) [Deinococcus sp. KNUC1210]|uniref:GNAT family N-acetyltransferase n=1 Tax=Deinococcus sp. KNUC1210 TaxID=2917691 RepID=UPI001EF08DD2|nr:GNAT family protein [Deinococcus sp. KNUC1210]ULH13940.1 GNAT family N-acetyltransferase [Deinococcus sp. KNUC1210]
MLRPFLPQDQALVFEAALDPLIPLITTVPSPCDEVQALAFIERQHDRFISGTGYSLAIAEATTSVAVGQIGLWLRDLSDGRATIGYWVVPSARRKGAAFHALWTLSEWGLAQPGIDRLQLYIEPWNEGSWRTAQRVGYRREGLLRSWQRVGQERRDMYMYSLLTGDLQPWR